MESFVHSSNEITIEKLAHYLKRKHLLPAHQEQEKRNVKRVIKSIELIPLPPEGRSHQNKLVINYAEEKLSHTTILPNQYFYLVYLLCLERLDDQDSRWLPKDKNIAKIHIDKLKKIAQNRTTIDYSWIKRQQQLSTVVSYINKKAKYRFILQEDYITLVPELRDASSIILK